MFDYVWHCHIVEHEDNEMMRPYRIGAEAHGQPMPTMPSLAAGNDISLSVVAVSPKPGPRGPGFGVSGAAVVSDAAHPV